MWRKAEMFAAGALGVFSDYHYALGALAQVRNAQKRYEEAVKLLRTRYAAAPHAENLFALAEALELAGKTEEAQKDFGEFERQSLKATNIGDDSSHELMAYYTDHAHQPEKALEVAQRELERRKDVFTLDCYAWALAASLDFASTNIEIQKALQVGVRDPQIRAHAQYIAEHLNAVGTKAE